MAVIKQKIVPHLWFDRAAKEAAGFYCSVFPDSGLASVATLRNTPSGDCDIVTFTLWGYSFAAIGAGPEFKFNPSVSFLVNFDPSQDKDAKTRIDEMWAKLADGGQILMPLDAYPFSKRYGWIQDRYGLSWQLMLTNPEGEVRPFIIPALMFTGDKTGQADEAIDFYASAFKDAKRGMSVPYPPGAAPEKDARLMFGEFMLEGQWFAAMDSGRMHKFSFNEAVSFMVKCEDQNEIDRYWEKLSAVSEAEQCGWLKDKYGLSWQIVPDVMDEMMKDQEPERLDRVVRAFLKMKKFDLATLQRAYNKK